MDWRLVFKRIKSIQFDLLVLKGFPVEVILKLGEKYPILDKYIYTKGKIDLTHISAPNLLQGIMGMRTPSICSCESLIKLCSNISNLDILGKKIVVLENNLSSLYLNPTIESIPDYDSDAFEETDTETPLYACFYSYAVKEGNLTKVQYIDNFSQEGESILKVPFIEPGKIHLSTKEAHSSLSELTNGVIDRMLKIFSETGDFHPEGGYIIDLSSIDRDRLKVFVGIGKFIGKTFKIFNQDSRVSILPRNELKSLLNKVWGYPEFRKLQVYQNLLVNKDVIEIGQDEIIECVIQECEKGLSNHPENLFNVLLTAPTGAGKSLLFQAAAIYLAEKYEAMTIVVSPLVALMDDQVDGLAGFQRVATLNSNRSAAAKAEILSQIRNGEVDILYLSPELLLSYNISYFIGERRLGLIVVDEAHTVTTWGRDFRVDYLFLGDYIRKSKKVLGYSFPIFALTATAVYDPSGKNDMVFDTIRSLHMDPCIKYIGNVKRTNIGFQFSLSGIATNYEQQRRKLTINKIQESIDNNVKTIVYFPFKKTINDIIYSEEFSNLLPKTAVYHAGLFQNQKIQNALDFKSGLKTVMCATKAYGMGVDISDIKEVYHHAPSGSLADYVQEIGRIARDPNISGIAKLDFSNKDFKYIRQLHGISTIKTYQLKEVLKKLMGIYRLNGEKRNMLISASDFSYIFPHADIEGVDQYLKSSLLLIGNDLLNKLGFHSLIVRPKSLFSKCYIGIASEEVKSFYKFFKPYLHKEEECIYLLDADRLWQDNFPNLSFPNFKFKLAEGKIFPGWNYRLKTKILVSLHDSIENTKAAIIEFFELSNSFILYMSRSHHRLPVDEMMNKLPSRWSKEKKERFVETFRLIYTNANILGEPGPAYCSLHTSTIEQSGVKLSFQFLQSGYENIQLRYLSVFKEFFNSEELKAFVDPSSPLYGICEFLNSYGLAEYQRLGGEEPMIFVRINNPVYLNSLIRNKNYENAILNNIYDKQAYAERIFTYFFTTPMTDEERWDFIEAYFLGESEDKLLKNQARK